MSPAPARAARTYTITFAPAVDVWSNRPGMLPQFSELEPARSNESAPVFLIMFHIQVVQAAHHRALALANVQQSIANLACVMPNHASPKVTMRLSRCG